MFGTDEHPFMATSPFTKCILDGLSIAFIAYNLMVPKIESNIRSTYNELEISIQTERDKCEK